MKLERMEEELTAGSAKKDIPMMAKKDATNFPPLVVGTLSPYPTVVKVT